MNAKPTVFVVDDDVSVRRSVEFLIRSAGWQSQTFASAQEFLSRRRVPGPGCLVLDVRLPDADGLELQKRIADDGAGMPIIFITGYGDVPISVRAMKAGAVEFLTKPFRDDVLLAAIRNAIDCSCTALKDAAELRVLRDRYAALTHRQQEIMALIASGLLNKQAGAELGISEITVKAHRRHMMRRMKAGSVPDLVSMAAKLGLLSAPQG